RDDRRILFAAVHARRLFRSRRTGERARATLRRAQCALRAGGGVMELHTAPSFRLDGKRALVSGAGRGIGLAAASALADAGAHVTLAARTGDEVAQAAAAIRARGQNAAALALDVIDLAAVTTAIAAAEPFDV